MNDFLKKIQQGNTQQKKRRLIILSAIAMIIILIAWFYYMNAVVFQSPDSTTTQEVNVDFWSTFKTGIGVTLGNTVSNIKDSVSGIYSEIGKLKGK